MNINDYPEVKAAMFAFANAIAADVLPTLAEGFSEREILEAALAQVAGYVEEAQQGLPEEEEEE